jgi:hypothetical protein
MKSIKHIVSTFKVHHTLHVLVPNGAYTFNYLSHDNYTAVTGLLYVENLSRNSGMHPRILPGVSLHSIRTKLHGRCDSPIRAQ